MTDSAPIESAPVSDNFFRPHPGPLAVYLHFPFCTNRCHYCDFFKQPFHPDKAKSLFRAVAYETELVLAAFGHEPMDIASVYIGGGTPSLADPRLLTKWVRLLETYCRFLPDYEFSIEVNPESFTMEFADAAVEAGVNRVVIGVQSFATSALRAVGRRQTTKDIYRAFYHARSAGFENIGADLIFGLPGQTLKKVRVDIDRLTALEPDHVSFYQLTIEPGTPLAERIAAGKVELPDEEIIAAMYKIGAYTFMDREYKRYEVSNFAHDGFHSRHNYAYWTERPYIGLGPAAHGFVNNHRYSNVADVDRYIEATESGIVPITFIEELTDCQKLTETIMLSLQTAEGLDKQKLVTRFGESGSKIIESDILVRHVNDGYLIDAAGFVRLSDIGFLFADKLIGDLVGVG